MDEAYESRNISLVDAEVDGHYSTRGVFWDDLSRHIGRWVRLDHERRVCYTMHSNKESFAAAIESGKMRIIVPNTGVRMWRGDKLQMKDWVLRVKELHDYIIDFGRHTASSPVCVVCGLKGNPVLSLEDGIAAHTEMVEEFYDLPDGALPRESDALGRGRLTESKLVDCPVCRQHWHLGCGACLRRECTNTEHDLKKTFAVIANYEPLKEVDVLTCCWCSFVMAAARADIELEYPVEG